MSDLECRQFVEEVTLFLDGALGPEAEQDLSDHLALCDGCERYLDQMRQTARALEDPPADALPGDTRSTLLDTFRSRRA
jgi:anti-sigma factor RsiW